MKPFKKIYTRNRNDNIHAEIDISKNIGENLGRIKNDFGHCDDLIVNSFKFNNHSDINCAFLYINNLVDKNIINSLSSDITQLKYELSDNNPNYCFSDLINCFSGLRDTKKGTDYTSLYSELLSGNTVLLIDGYKEYIAVTNNSNEGRSVEEPTSQTIVRGPKEGFTENVNTNILLIRKRIRNRALKIEYISVGNVSKTTVGLMYIDHIAKDDIIQTIRDRLSKIEIDGILDSGYIEEMIKDDRHSIFPTFLSSEKPDSVTAALLEGRVAIIVDGTPYVLTAPALMIEFLQASEDYYHHYITASVIRVFRYIAFSLTLLVPALFVALTTFHQEMIPTPLLVSIAAQREGVPFPALIEALTMELTFEILREAGIRMPRAIGPAISIVGALVLGQAAVEAGLISAAIVIVISITAICSFAIPNYEMAEAIMVLRFIFIILAGFLGLYGVFMGLIILALHLCKLKSIGIPYLTPIAPKVKGGNKDTILRYPLWKMKYRPAGISATNEPRVNQKKPVSPNEKKRPEFEESKS